MRRAMKGSTRDWSSNSHLIRAHYGGLGFLKMTAFTYLLDFRNDAPIRMILRA